MTTHNVMLDLETLGTKPGCAILSIGASNFQIPSGFPSWFFQAAITVESQDEVMDVADPDTIRWWSEQSSEAQHAAFSNPFAIPIATALEDFNIHIAAIKQTPEDRVLIWGKGATFDEPILREAMIRFDITPAWEFRDSMCFRTLAKLGQFLDIAEPPFTGVKHNALADACHQAKWADRILDTIIMKNELVKVHMDTAIKEQTDFMNKLRKS